MFLEKPFLKRKSNIEKITKCDKEHIEKANAFPENVF